MRKAGPMLNPAFPLSSDFSYSVSSIFLLLEGFVALTLERAIPSPSLPSFFFPLQLTRLLSKNLLS